MADPNATSLAYLCRMVGDNKMAHTSPPRCVIEIRVREIIEHMNGKNYDRQKRTTDGIHCWSPTQLLAARFMA